MSTSYLLIRQTEPLAILHMLSLLRIAKECMQSAQGKSALYR
ncbi:unnamed protein product [Staurois parvus]|uniref:Uncharacterized protein n=1 Tax=Staurois parvus TaxID=386267 RepID=A0ABN9DR50_9NEOB|nr:unnamed protein product [Staurois parvus]